MTTSADPLPDQLKAALTVLHAERLALELVIADPTKHKLMKFRLVQGRCIAALAHVEELRALLLLKAKVVS